MCFRPCDPKFPVSSGVGTSESDVESLIVEDVDASKVAHPVVEPSAPKPVKCDGMQISVDDFDPASTLSLGDSSSCVAGN